MARDLGDSSANAGVGRSSRSSLWIPAATALLVVAIAFPVGLMLGRSSPDVPAIDAPRSSNDPLSVSASRLDFGKVGVEKAFA